ncbi:unnamed protein product, partial [Discosporangium mesarthrocarpum]
LSIYFNSIFSAMLMLLVRLFLPGETERILRFERWTDPTFLVLYSPHLSVLQYSMFLCTKVNPALTTSVVGCLKNVVTTLLGMLGVGVQCEFVLLNFSRLLISMAGSFLYSWAKVARR